MTKQQEVPARYTADWLHQLDGRLAVARELRTRYAEMTADLGGASSLSYAQKSLCSRALFLELHLQQEEQKLVEGKDFDSGRWVQSCNALAGIFGKLSLSRRQKDVPDLQSILREAKA